MSKTMANRYAGPCADCAEWIPQGLGIVTGNRNGRYGPAQWRLTHLPVQGSLNMFGGGYTGGCPPEDRKRRSRTVVSHAVYVVRIGGKEMPPDSMDTSGILATLRNPIPGVEITREYRTAIECRFCHARPAAAGYCDSPQCKAGRTITATRAIRATHVVRQAA